MPSLLGICFWRAAPGAVVGPDRRAGKRGSGGAEIAYRNGLSAFPVTADLQGLSAEFGGFQGSRPCMLFPDACFSEVSGANSLRRTRSANRNLRVRSSSNIGFTSPKGRTLPPLGRHGICFRSFRKDALLNAIDTRHCWLKVVVTADHRILDGAEVARFLQTLAESVGE